MGSIATEGFEANRPGAGVKIDKAATVKSWRKYVEKRLPQPIAGWTSLHTAWSDQLT